jgi:hypothetical protein
MSSKTAVNMKRELMVPGRVVLTARGFSIDIFTNDQGICVQLRSDAQNVSETPLDEMQRAWGNKTA